MSSPLVPDVLANAHVYSIRTCVRRVSVRVIVRDRESPVPSFDFMSDAEARVEPVCESRTRAFTTSSRLLIEYTLAVKEKVYVPRFRHTAGLVSTMVAPTFVGGSSTTAAVLAWFQNCQ